MKNTLPFLFERFESPGAWQAALRNWLEKNGSPVTQEKVLMDMVLYHQLILSPTAALEYKFFQGSVDNTAASQTNVVGSFARNQGEHFIIAGIRLMTGVNATLSATSWSYGTVDAAAKNGNLSYINNTTQVLRNIPGTVFNPNLTTEDQGMHWLSEPLLWAGQTPIQLNFTIPAVLGATTNIRCELHGFGLNA